eukprot:Em0021g538a
MKGINEATGESPSVIVYPTTTSSDTGGVVILSCVVFAIPIPNITWSVTNQYGSTNIVQNTSSTTIKTSTLTVSNYTYTVSYLVICNTTENNTGTYSCAGSNGVNVTSLTTTSESFLVTIKDINECTLNISGCSQQCINTPGSYYCACYTGYKLEGNLKTCNGELEGLAFDLYLITHMLLSSISSLSSSGFGSASIHHFAKVTVHSLRQQLHSSELVRLKAILPPTNSCQSVNQATVSVAVLSTLIMHSPAGQVVFHLYTTTI